MNINLEISIVQILFPTEYGYKKSGRLTEGVAFFQKFDWQKPQL